MRVRKSSRRSYGAWDDSSLELLVVAGLLMLAQVWALAMAVGWSLVAAWPVMVPLGIGHDFAEDVPPMSFGATFACLLSLRLVMILVVPSSSGSRVDVPARGEQG